MRNSCLNGDDLVASLNEYHDGGMEKALLIENFGPADPMVSLSLIQLVGLSVLECTLLRESLRVMNCV